LFGAFASGFLKQEKLTFAKWVGCLLGFAGAALVVRLGPVEPTPAIISAALICMGGAAFSGVATPYLKRAMTRMEPLAVTAGMHAAAVILMLPGALYDLPRANFTPQAVASVCAMGIATSGLAYWLYMRIVRHVPPMAALSSTFMSTGFGVLWAVILLNEPTGVVMMTGGTMILLACMLVFGLNPLQWSVFSATDKG
jgi:drug/metabolite transporter (DMT)-like permease